MTLNSFKSDIFIIIVSTSAAILDTSPVTNCIILLKLPFLFSLRYCLIEMIADLEGRSKMAKEPNIILLLTVSL